MYWIQAAIEPGAMGYPRGVAVCVCVYTLGTITQHVFLVAMLQWGNYYYYRFNGGDVWWWWW